MKEPKVTKATRVVMKVTKATRVAMKATKATRVAMKATRVATVATVQMSKCIVHADVMVKKCDYYG